MDNELEVIRDEMEQTRANLADKLGALENQVRETVSGATDAVSSTVEGVKEVVSSVSETVETVTETFNVSKQVEQHPWMAFGAAVAAGFVVAQVVSRASQPAHAPPPPPAPPAPEPHRQHAAESHKGPGVLHSLESMMPDMHGVMNTMVSSLGGLAVGGLMGVIRELAATGLPEEWKGEATKLIDQVTTQLGGKPLDTAKSSQLFDALGLGGKSHEAHDQGEQNQGGQTQLASGQGSSLSGEEELGYGTRGMRSAGRQPTTQTW